MNNTNINVERAFGGTWVANNIKLVISSGKPSIPSSNHKIGKIMSGKLATCLISMTWLTAKLIWTRARARNDVPISYWMKTNNFNMQFIAWKSLKIPKKRITYRLNIDEELMLFFFGWWNTLNGCTQAIVTHVEMWETQQDWWIYNWKTNKTILHQQKEIHCVINIKCCIFSLWVCWSNFNF